MKSDSQKWQARPIRSFVLRQGRMTLGQNAALEKLWPLFGLDSAQDFNATDTFGRDAPLILEIGFGNGESLAQMALQAPEEDFLGVEVHRPGVGHLLLKVAELGLRNVRVYCADAVDVLQHRIPSNSLHRVHVFFPDPWQKKRHHKRRLVNAGFVALVADRLKPGGVLHCATDWEDYALHMLAVLEASARLRNQAGKGCIGERTAGRPLTKFEARGQRLGHGVWDLLFEKCG
jgi:tRNA (guanine-N7-)-methyltransferase